MTEKDKKKNRRNNKKWLVGGLVGTVVLALAIVGLTYFLGDKKDEDKDDDDAYEVVTLAEQDPISVKGTVELDVDDSYSYKEELGTIDSISVSDGQTVAKGDVLFTYFLTSPDIKATVREAERAVTKLYNERQRLQSNPGPSAAELEELGEDAAAFSPEAAIEEINDQIRDAEEALAQAKDAQYQSVTAKRPGTAQLDLDGQTSADIPLVRVIGDETFIRGTVSEYDFFALGTDRAVSIQVNATDEKVDGMMTYFDEYPAGSSEAAESFPSGEDAGDMSSLLGGGGGGDTRGSSRYAFTVRPEKYIHPGFSVNMMITVPGISIPEEALVMDEDDDSDEPKYYVFVYDKGVAKKVAVDYTKQGTLYITNQKDLPAGTKVILNADGLKDGEEISVKGEDSDDESDDTDEADADDSADTEEDTD